VTMSLGTLHLVMMLFWMFFTMVDALISVNASILTHLVKYSVEVKMKDFFLISLVLSSKGPTTSKVYMANGHGVEIEWREDEGA